MELTFYLSLGDDKSVRIFSRSSFTENIEKWFLLAVLFILEDWIFPVQIAAFFSLFGEFRDEFFDRIALLIVCILLKQFFSILQVQIERQSSSR